MAGAVEVTDSLSNTEEQIERAAKTIGKSKVRRAVFDAIYHHKSPVKTVEEIAGKTGYSRMRVLQAGGFLARRRRFHRAHAQGKTGAGVHRRDAPVPAEHVGDGPAMRAEL